MPVLQFVLIEDWGPTATLPRTTGSLGAFCNCFRRTYRKRFGFNLQHDKQDKIIQAEQNGVRDCRNASSPSSWWMNTIMSDDPLRTRYTVSSIRLEMQRSDDKSPRLFPTIIATDHLQMLRTLVNEMIGTILAFLC